MIKRGDKGQRVREAQRALVTLGYALPKFGVDGDYGAETEAAIGRWASERCIAREPWKLHEEARVRLLRQASDQDMTPTPPPAPPVAATYGAFLWQADKLTTPQLLALCAETGIDRVMPKVLNKHGRPMYQRTLASHIPAMQDAGIQVIPWAYLDDHRGAQDARKLVQLALGYDCTGAVANMEREIVDGDTRSERDHDAEQIRDVLAELREGLPGFVGFSSFRRRDYFPYPRDVFEAAAAAGVTFMPQCYNQKTAQQARSRTRKSAESWLSWDLPCRMTLGAFPPRASQSKTFGSQPEGMIAAADEVRGMARSQPLLDAGFDWWAVEQVRWDYADPSYREALATAHRIGG